jgi:NADPH2:quinone reductase
MKAWLIDDLKSGVGQLRVGDVMDPVPEPGEAVVDVRYAALNPADRYLSEGQYPAKPSLPHVLGRDAVGIVREVASDVRGFKPGDPVLLLRSEVGVNRPGAFAERFAVPVESLVPVPPLWDEDQAAGAPLVYLTAYQALTAWGELPRDSVVLVTGASGGVGVASVQLARALGHTVVALSRSPVKRDHLERLGATHAVDPAAADWRQTVKQLLGRRRVDLAVDSVGGEAFNQVLDVMGEHGRVSCVGQLAGAVPSFKTASLFFRRLKVGGVAVGAYTAAESRTAWSAVLDLLARVGGRPLVDRVFSFDQLPQAFDRLKAGPMGKVVLAVGGRA